MRIFKKVLTIMAMCCTLSAYSSLVEVQRASSSSFDPNASLWVENGLKIQSTTNLSATRELALESASCSLGDVKVSRVARRAEITLAVIKTGYVVAKDYSTSGTEENSTMSITSEDGKYYINNVYGLGGKVEMSINTETGTVSITPQNAYTHKTYGDIYMYPIEINGSSITYSESSAITGTIDVNGKISLGSWALIASSGTYKGGLLAAFSSSEWVPANATMTATKGDDSQITYPLLLEQSSSNELKIYGFGTVTTPVVARLDANHKVSVSPQYITTISIYGDFYCYSYDASAGTISTVTPISGTGTNNSISFGGWIIGAKSSPTTAALVVKSCSLTSTVEIKYPEKVAVNFSGAGTKTSPYLISSASDLVALSQSVENGNSYSGVYFKLSADIDMNNYAGSFTPIGSAETFFNAHFDGDNHTISNLEINGLGYNYQGLIGVLGSYGSVSNLKVSKAKVSGNGNYIAAIVGYALAAIDNCEVTDVDIVSQGVCVGAVAGRTYAAVTNCSTSGKISAYGYAGGVSGYSLNVTRACSSSATISIDGVVSQSNVCAGGIVGLAQSYSTARECVVSDCYFTGSVNQSVGYGFTGGVIGYLYTAEINNCFNTGSVYTTVSGSDQCTGGVCGLINDVVMSNCYNAGTVKEAGISSYVGGLIGYISCLYSSTLGMQGASTAISSYNSGNVIGGSRTDHCGVFGGEFISANFTEHPSQGAFINVYSDNQATGVSDTQYGKVTSYLTAGKLPEGFDASVWSATQSYYPVLTKYAATDAAKLSMANVVFADNESSNTMKHAATVVVPDGVKCSLLSAGRLLSKTGGLTLTGNNITLNGAYANDTVALYVAENNITRYYPVNVVPKLFDGEGTEASPYLIKDESDFALLDEAVMHYDHKGDYFKLTADVNFNYSKVFSGVAAGNHLKEFAGVFDGDNHTISKLRIQSVYKSDAGSVLDGTYNYGGLFHIGAESSVIKNIKIAADCDFSFYNIGGAVIGYTSGRVENCYNYASIPVSGITVGGVVGYVTETGVVDGCYNSGDITCTGKYAGGVVGYNLGTCTSSQNDGDIYASVGYAGGVVGVSAGSIDNCLNNGAVAGEDYVGGILGSNSSLTEGGNVTASVSTGVVTVPASASQKGGLIGYSNGRGNVAYNYYEASVNPFAGCSSIKTGINQLYTEQMVSGKIPEGLSDAKWVFNENLYPALKQFANEDASVAKRSIFVKFAESQIRTNMITSAPLSTSSKITWKLAQGKAFSIADGELKVSLPENSVAADTLTATYDDKYVKSYALQSIPNILPGQGTEVSPFLISTVDDISKLGAFIAASGMEYEGYYFRVENDINYSESDEFSPIGSTSVNFSGDFDGNGKTIAGFKYSNTASATGKYIGFFYNIGAAGTVHDLTLNGDLTSYQYTGGFAGKLYGTLRNCVNKSSVACSSMYAGGLAGAAFDGALIVNSGNEGAVQSATAKNYIGGICSVANQGAVIDSCYNAGTVGYVTEDFKTGSQYVGGIVSTLNGNVTNSYNKGDVMGRMYLAGICAASKATDTISNCYNAADIYTTLSYVGGIVAQSTANSKAVIENCYNTGAITGSSYVGGVIGNLQTGLTVADCHNEGVITGSSFCVGGVVGMATGSATTTTQILRSYNIGKINGVAQSVGGFGGKMSSAYMADCFNLGKVVVNSAKEITSAGVGGFVGSMCGVAERVWNAGDVESNVSGVGGLVGIGAMPIATLRNSFNLGNVTATLVISKSNYNVAGIWSGYGPAVIENCYNMGTITGPSNVAGINAGMHTNANGGSSITNCYNAGKLVATEADGCANIGATGTGVDATLLSVSNSYYDSSCGGNWGTEDGATAMTTSQLMNANLGDAYNIQRACLPTLKAVADNVYANHAAAMVEFADGESADNVKSTFYLGQLQGVEWSSSDNVTIGDEGAARPISGGEGWVKASAEYFGRSLEKVFNLTLNVVTGVDEIDANGKTCVERVYFQLNGIRVSEPQPGTVYIVKSIYDDNSVKIDKILIAK